MRTVSILGCGWLGEPLAVSLKEAGFLVRGSARDPEKLPALLEKGVEPHLIDISPEVSGENTDEFFSSDVLFINFPPERRDDIETYHEKQIRNLIGAIPNPRRENGHLRQFDLRLSEHKRGRKGTGFP